MKGKGKLIRTLRLTAIILSAFFILASLGTHFIPRAIQERGFTQNENQSVNLNDAYVSVPSKAKRLGLEFNIPGVDPEAYLEFTAPGNVFLLGYGEIEDVTYLAGDTAVMTLSSLPGFRFGERFVSVGRGRTNARLTVAEDVLARCYIAYLEQTGQTELFSLETGLELNEKNALTVLTAVDKEIYENGGGIPSGYPLYMRTTRTIRNACLYAMGVSLAFLLAMLIICHFVDTTDWTEENKKLWRQRGISAREMRMTSLSKSAERAPPEDTNKNKTQNELFRDLRQ